MGGGRNSGKVRMWGGGVVILSGGLLLRLSEFRRDDDEVVVLQCVACTVLSLVCNENATKEDFFGIYKELGCRLSDVWCFLFIYGFFPQAQGRHDRLEPDILSRSAFLSTLVSSRYPGEKTHSILSVDKSGGELLSCTDDEINIVRLREKEIEIEGEREREKREERRAKKKEKEKRKKIIEDEG